jgi:hypothetical protein
MTAFVSTSLQVVTFLALMFLALLRGNETLTRTLKVSDSVSYEQGEESGAQFTVSMLDACLDCALLDSGTASRNRRRYIFPFKGISTHEC